MRASIISVWCIILINFFVMACNDNLTSTKKSLIKAKNVQKTSNLKSTLKVWHRDSHPRVLLDKERLQLVIHRMYGYNAREPFSGWFNLLKTSEDNGNEVDLVSLSLIYQSTKNPIYKKKFLDRLPKTGVPNLTELYAIDIMFDDLADETKHLIMRRVADSKNPWYSSSIQESQGKKRAKWGYHDAYKVAPAFAYAAIFIDTELEINKDKTIFPFDAQNYLEVVDQQLSADGHFHNIENRISGDPKFNGALPGKKGGMYDNTGYDSSEEASSIYLFLQHYVLTGQDKYQNAMHEKYRADFYQHLLVPFTQRDIKRTQWCRKAETSYRTTAQIWNTQTSSVSQPNKNTTAVTAFLYQDPKMQYFVKNGIQKELCGAPYNGLFWELIYYDDTLTSSPPKDQLETSAYFSGPGIVTMRSSWDKDATFGVFMAGEGISRRYEDANSFLISRKTEVIPHGGARIRFNEDNMNHFWYHIRSASKNTLKIIDPNESYDILTDGSIGPIYSGTKLVSTDNLGGQIFETIPSSKNGCYNVYQRCNKGKTRNGDAFPLGIYETANIIKYEHKEGSYTYSVGDASAAYSKKVEYFEREFLFINPDIFVIFDRVKSINPSFKKIWTIHTVDQPVVNSPYTHRAMGLSRYKDFKTASISHPKNHTYIDTLLPKRNIATIRGGDTTLILKDKLESIRPVDLDIPRWLEVFVLGNDTIGSLIITGETKNEKNSREVITFDGKKQTYAKGNPTYITRNRLHDEKALWKENQWQGYQLTYMYSQESYTTIIQGNSKNELFGEFIPTASYKYSIERPFANTYKHWKKINKITTNDMDINEIRVTVPHYFDTVDSTGHLHSFAPHTDFIDDKYQKEPNIGQWTMDIQASEPKLLDNFAHVISLKDPNDKKPKTALVESSNAFGIVVNNYLAIFSKDNTQIENLTMELNDTTEEILIINLIPNALYNYKFDKKGDKKLMLSLGINHNTSGNNKSSPMGLIKLNVDQ
ncbi:MAG: hypothetical protein ACI93P_001617 [bacterium]|jgi:hypothetical protein